MHIGYLYIAMCLQMVVIHPHILFLCQLRRLKDNQSPLTISTGSAKSWFQFHSIIKQLGTPRKMSHSKTDIYIYILNEPGAFLQYKKVRK